MPVAGDPDRTINSDNTTVNNFTDSKLPSGDNSNYSLGDGEPNLQGEGDPNSTVGIDKLYDHNFTIILPVSIAAS